MPNGPVPPHDLTSQILSVKHRAQDSSHIHSTFGRDSKAGNSRSGDHVLQFRDMLARALTLDPQKRVSASVALKDLFFKDVIDR